MLSTASSRDQARALSSFLRTIDKMDPSGTYVEKYLREVFHRHPSAAFIMAIKLRGMDAEGNEEGRITLLTPLAIISSFDPP